MWSHGVSLHVWLQLLMQTGLLRGRTPLMARRGNKSVVLGRERKGEGEGKEQVEKILFCMLHILLFGRSEYSDLVVREDEGSFVIAGAETVG